MNQHGRHEDLCGAEQDLGAAYRTSGNKAGSSEGRFDLFGSQTVEGVNVRNKMRQLSSLAIATLLFIMISLGALHAQIAGAGNIQGTITDQSGALLPKATVTLINKATGTKQVTTSDDAGAYSFPNISIGTYSVEVGATGFQTYEQSGIVLEVGSNIAINASLSVGRSDVKVEVQSTALSLQTEDVSFKQTIDEKAVTEMPLNGRQMASLIVLSGGSSPAPNGDFTGSKYSYQTISVSVAGGSGNTTEWKLDGGDNNDYMSNANLPFPFPDAVSQFSVESTALSSSGLHSGGLVNVVTRSGTNKYHGTGFEFIRNNYINATNFFANKKDQLHQNQFGGTVGGPVRIPFLYNGTDKLFFFSGYQRLISKQATSNVSMFIPTAANLAGDYSLTDPAPGTPYNASTSCNQPAQLVDPLTGAILPGNKYGQPGGPPVPTYNKQALALYKYFPAIDPKVDTNGCGKVQFAVPSQVFDNEFVTRIDYNINAKHNLYGRYFIDGYQAPSFFSPTNVLITYLAPGNFERVQTMTVGENYVISPNLVNSAHITGTKRVDIRQSVAGINANTVGINVNQDFPTGLQLVASTTGKDQTFSTYCGTCSAGHFNVDTEGFSDDLTYIRGKHQFVFGGEYTRVHFNEVAGYEANGNFTFTGQFSGSGPNGGTVLGDSNLDFLQGSLSGFEQSKQQQLALRGSIPSLYIQDTFHASKKLTIVGGLRWEPEYMPYDYFGRGSVFNMSSFMSNQVSSVYPKSPAGIFYYGDQGVPKSNTKNTPWQFSPNFGASYDLRGDGKTVVRGGFAFAYDLANYYTSNRVHQNPPFATAARPNTGGQLCFSTPWLVGTSNTGSGSGCNQPGGVNTSPFPQPTIPTPATASFPAQAQYVVLPDQFHVSETVQYTLSVQHQFKGGWQAQIDYIGNKTTHMPTGTPLSPAIFIPGSWGANGTGCAGIVTTGPAAVKPDAAGFPCSTTANQNSRYALTIANPYQGNQISGGGSGSTLINDIGYGNYNGVILTLQHRLSSTFSFLANYTLSKCLNVSDATGDVAATPTENPNNLRMDYARCGSDYRNIFNTTLVAKSHFPLHGLAGYAVNNWELAPLIHTLSGAPINITNGADNSQTAVGNDRPDQVPGVNPINFVNIRSGTGAANRSYINSAAFVQHLALFDKKTGAQLNSIPYGTYGNVGRNSISGPMTFQFDAQISRIFPIHEQLATALRLEAFNVLNHPSFANPSSSNPAASSFGQITATNGGPRIFQGSVKIIF
jgi:hypothetical protein